MRKTSPLNMNLGKAVMLVTGLFLTVMIVFLSATGARAAASGTVADAGQGRSTKVHMPDAPGKETITADNIVIDISNAADGYIVASYTGTNKKPKLQISKTGSEPYLYDLNAGKDEVFPLTEGSGQYQVTAYENLAGTEYVTIAADSMDVSLDDEKGPFLYPSQYVDFTQKSKAVALGQELAASAKDEIGIITNIYDYVVGNLQYDLEKAEKAAKGELPGYLPDIDETLRTGKGICFDYAAVMTAMLRSQGIPAQLQIGYADDIYHAWISVYTKEKGLIHNIIEFDGKNWTLMDPTPRLPPHPVRHHSLWATASHTTQCTPIDTHHTNGRIHI